MKHFPDFSAHGYQIIRELGRNREGGRITWQASVIPTESRRTRKRNREGEQIISKAMQQATDHTVLLKQFCFAQVGSDWSAFSEHERELNVLQRLSHPGIPHYIKSFETTDGFCLVQEYMDARSLSGDRTFSPEHVQQIASSVLDILVYLQSQTPIVIHRDIKPENILVDDQLKAYLIDFGFARIGSGDISGSSVFRGTPGFIPPEQLWQPTKATDLYGLGATLLCLLTRTSSSQIHNLTDLNDPYMFQFASRLPTLSQDFIYWLHKMVEPRQSNRFPDAKTALKALQALQGLSRSPEVVLEPNFKLFLLRSNRYGEKLTQTITLSNPVPDTLLEGKWEVAPHPHDLPHRPDTHSWISIRPTEFRQNDIKCQVQVETSKLLEGEVYERQLLLHTNAALKPRSLTLKIHTSPLNHIKPLPYAALTLLLLISGGVTWLAMSGLISRLILAEIPVITFVVTTVVAFLAIEIGLLTVGSLLYWLLNVVVGVLRGDANNSSRYLSRYGTFNFYDSLLWGGGTIAFMAALYIGMFAAYPRSCSDSRCIFSDLFYKVLGFLGDILPFLVVIFSLLLLYKNLTGRGFKKSLVYALLILTVGLGSSIGISFVLGNLNSTLLLALAGTGLPLALLVLKPTIQQNRLLAKYRKSKELLIKP